MKPTEAKIMLSSLLPSPISGWGGGSDRKRPNFFGNETVSFSKKTFLSN